MPETLNRLKHAVPHCLQHIFSGNRILPYDIPEWLRDCVSIKRLPLPGNEVDLDVDIPKMFHALHQRTLELLSDAKNSDNIQQAKELLQDMLLLVPKHAVTLYNLSCAESLLGNISQAIAALKSAIEDAGYSNLDHMEKDPDLNNIRDVPEFQQLVQVLKKDVVPMEVPKEEKPKEEVVPMEIPKEEPKSNTVSVGEHKWKEAIHIIKEMGFDKNVEYFGPKCAVLMEKHNGDMDAVINELLM